MMIFGVPHLQFHSSFVWEWMMFLSIQFQSTFDRNVCIFDSEHEMCNIWCKWILNLKSFFTCNLSLNRELRYYSLQMVCISKHFNSIHAIFTLAVRFLLSTNFSSLYLCEQSNLIKFYIVYLYKWYIRFTNRHFERNSIPELCAFQLVAFNISNGNLHLDTEKVRFSLWMSIESNWRR